MLIVLKSRRFEKFLQFKNFWGSLFFGSETQQGNLLLRGMASVTK